MITVRYIPNILSARDRKTFTLGYKPTLTVSHVLKESHLSAEGHRVILTGKAIFDLNKELKDGDEIILTPEVKFDPATWATIVAWAATIYTVATYAMVAYAIYTAVTYRNQAKQGFGISSDGIDDGSPTYGWDGAQTVNNVGVAIPVVYGEHIVGGNVINQYVRTDGESQYLNTLLALCEGEIEGITGLLINDNPSSNFNGITMVERLGTNNQTFIPNFADNHSTTAKSDQLLQSVDHTYTTTSTEVEAVELTLTLPSGLFQTPAGSASVQSWAVSYQVWYKKHTDPGWTDAGVQTISGLTRNAIRRVFRIDALPADQYDIKIRRTSADSGLSPQMQGDLYLTMIDEITVNEKLTYPNVALLSVEALATDQLSGNPPNYKVTVKGKKVSVPDIRSDGVFVPWENYYYDPNTEQFKLLSDNSVLTWDGVSYVNAYCANPIWCMKDLLLNSRYGLGEFMSASIMDDAEMLSMAKYCDEKVSDGNGGYEKRFRLDIVLDSTSRAMDTIVQVCSSFRAYPVYSNGVVRIKIDRAESPVQLFGMGNIIEKTFAQSWKGLRDVPNCVEVQYFDKEKNYEREIVAVIDEASLNAGNPLRKRQVSLFTTRMSQAIREGKYIINVAKYIERSVKLRAGIDAIACQVGDVVNISHDVPAWGLSGRIQADPSNTATHIHLDQPVTITGGKTYKLRIRFSDDTQEEKTISTGAGTVSEVDVSSAFSRVPQGYEEYSFGEDLKVCSPYRITEISKSGDCECDITAIEYDANIYDTDTIYLPDSNYSSLTTTIPTVADLTLEERSATLPDGTVESAIEVWWNKPDPSAVNVNPYKSAKIYLSDDAGSSWRLMGQTEGFSFFITGNLIRSASYTVKVLTVCSNGVEDKLSHAPSQSITILGKLIAPAAVSSFQYAWGDFLQLVWSVNTESDIAGYEIRDEDANFGTDNAHMIYRGAANKKALQPATRSPGTFYIRSFNTSGIYSIASASITPVNSSPSAPSGLGADVFFNVARLYWDDVADTDLKYYEVYTSETNAWAGEEVLAGKVSGKAFQVQGRKPRQGIAESADATHLIDSALDGLGDGYFNGDIIEIVAGVGAGQTRTISGFTSATGEVQISSAWDTTPDITSRYIIYDKKYIKVRGVDYFGTGIFTSSLAVIYESLESDSIAVSSVTPEKILTPCLSAISANMGMLTAGVIQGGTFQTGSGGARTVLDSYGLKSYDASCNKLVDLCNGVFCIQTGVTGARTIFDGTGVIGYNSTGVRTLEIKDGCICAQTLRLQDPTIASNYSFLDSGRLKFHDVYGDVPYLTRICSGTACTGGTVILPGWTQEPKVILGVRNLQSYNSTAAASCQSWTIYNDPPVCYCNCSTDYGYCFNVHACLTTAGSAGAACIRDLSFGFCYLTGTCVCSVYIRHRFQIWCNAACANYYYGCLCYAVCYRVSGSGTWCSCTFTYAQPHANTTELMSTQDVYNTVALPCGACWELMSAETGQTWFDSGISSATTCNCCVSVIQTSTGGLLQGGVLCCVGGAAGCCLSGYFEIADSWSATCDGSWTLYCTINGAAPAYCGYVQGQRCSGSFGVTCFYQVTFGTAVVNCSSGLLQCCYGTGTTTRCGTWLMCNNYSSYGCMCVSWCLLLGNCSRTRCYCKTFYSGTAACCKYENTYTTQDTYASQCVLDPAGCLNWLAIAY